MWLEQRNILVVEDNLLNLTVVKAFLTKWGAEVSHAENGQEAVEVCRERAFDLVLMDVMMPVMDGLQATRILRSEGFKGPILALTATVLEDEKESLLGSGMNNYLIKPFRPQELEQMIRGYLSDLEAA